MRVYRGGAALIQGMGLLQLLCGLRTGGGAKVLVWDILLILLFFAVWDLANGFGPDGSCDLGAAFAGGGLSQLTSLNMSCK